MEIDRQLEELLRSNLDKRCNDSYKYLEILYYTLREMKHTNRECFTSGEYKWVLGAQVARELDVLRNPVLTLDDPMYLFGIEVEIDYKNPLNIQIYEDITRKIAVPLEDDNNDRSK